jgi:glycosyltransferase involved in cell wall biosynthesis
MSEGRYNIAHILPWPYVGGTEHATLRIARTLEGDQFHSVAFCPGETSLVRTLFDQNGVETAVYQAVEPSYRRPTSFVNAQRELARDFKRRKIDLVHCSDMLAAHYAVLAGKLAGIPVLCHVRCCFDHISQRDQIMLRLVDRFAFVSLDVWKRFGFRVPARRGLVLYDGIEVRQNGNDPDIARLVRTDLELPENAKVIGMVARVTPAKDYATLIKAAAKVITEVPDAHFLIVGDYSESDLNRRHYEEVKRLLAEQRLERHFTFTGHREDIGRLISTMDVFVLSTHTEGLPLVILEAMAHGKPVIATAVGGIPEIIVHEENGLLHAPQDDRALAGQILDLIGDGERATRLGNAGRQFVSSGFNERQFATRIRNLYLDMLS